MEIRARGKWGDFLSRKTARKVERTFSIYPLAADFQAEFPHKGNVFKKVIRLTQS